MVNRGEFVPQAGARKVIALETHEELVELSRRAAELNGYSEVGRGNHDRWNGWELGRVGKFSKDLKHLL